MWQENKAMSCDKHRVRVLIKTKSHSHLHQVRKRLASEMMAQTKLDNAPFQHQRYSLTKNSYNTVI
ncbi:hypothetical protein A3K86_06005 [Photobacterium jeanii]|uniref:Uncharacterized protein n=1 Tax=Photobacterium jeanii TaxID=858640 RepID=A0A178KMH4_9GAMM|nr:hypothetical protein A3K86_06005 [Photobacterium jeanii]PST91878.1 hypothetical protein C9I91_01465 [Photobacterium jeanii]